MNADTINEMLAELRPADARRVEDWFSPEQQEALVREVTGHRRPERRTQRVRADRSRRRPLRRSVPVLVAAGVAAIAIAVASNWSSGASLAHAFPVLSAPTALTPATLNEALRIYGVDSSNDGLDIQRARPVTTPWGEAYVLTNPTKQAVCLAAPSPAPINWVASCAQTQSARTRGTPPVSFADNIAQNSVRVVALLPAGATASIVTSSRTRSVPIREDVLATTAEPGSELRITVHGRSFDSTVTTGDAYLGAAVSGTATDQSGSSTAAASVSVGGGSK